MTGRPILVTGGTGQLATSLAREDGSRGGGSREDGLRGGGSRVHVVGRPEFDFDSPDTIDQVLAAHAPALVVNAAAWTAVDAAEGAPDAADRANHAGPARLAASCRRQGVALVHVSTDYVFDGLKSAPYVEADPTNPTGVYGATKLAGELAVRRAHPDAVILRTSWVYARAGKNFVLTMLGAARRAPVLRVVADQHGCPTSADDLAVAILAVADRLLAGDAAGLGGVYHAAGQGATSWHGLAEAAFASAAAHGWPRPRVDAIATADWPTPARRPPDSRLDCTRLRHVFGVFLPPWQASLRRTVDTVCQAARTAGQP